METYLCKSVDNNDDNDEEESKKKHTQQSSKQKKQRPRDNDNFDDYDDGYIVLGLVGTAKVQPQLQIRKRWWRRRWWWWRRGGGDRGEVHEEVQELMLKNQSKKQTITCCLLSHCCLQLPIHQYTKHQYGHREDLQRFGVKSNVRERIGKKKTC